MKDTMIQIYQVINNYYVIQTCQNVLIDIYCVL